jgi:HEAT repeat protein/glucose/arabinose dehydrogenase
MRNGRIFAVVIAALLPRAQAGGADELVLPQTASGWTIELAHGAPGITGSSVLAGARDGTIFVGQNPAQQTGQSAPRNASVLLLKDDLSRTFAGKLETISGLVWQDGTLFAAHAPYLSALRDTDGDGRSDERTDLVTGLGPSRVATIGRDHGLGGIAIGLDGFLYLAVGDLGLPRAVGRDGRTIQLRGGGVIRVRTDGTGLEVVSTGERNPRSVVLSATDEVFTFGPGDESSRWPTSLTHHIVGGHYGYPYQFLTAPQGALPAMGREAGGAGVQGVCYNEGALPEKYRGNLFFCDPVRQCVLRFEIGKAGGTFAIFRRSSLVTKGMLADFQPVALETTADGAGFWIVDHRQDSRPGRLYRLTFTADDRPQPQPAPQGDDLERLVEALDHSALSVRLSSQRALARHGDAAVPYLARRLRTERPETGRFHTLWALDAVGTPAARQAIRDVVCDPAPQVRLQAIRSCGIRADHATEGELVLALGDRDPTIRREAAIAIGRLADPRLVDPLMVALGDSDRLSAWSIRTAIRRLGYPSSGAMLSAVREPRRRENALALAEESWSVPVIQALVQALKETPEPAVRGRIVAILAGQYRRFPLWSGDWWGPNPLRGPFPRKTESWSAEGMDAVLQGLRVGLADSDATVRLQSIVALGDVGAAAAPAMRAALQAETNPGNQATLVEAMGGTNDAASLNLLANLVTDPTRSEPVRAAALDALARFHGPDVLRARLSMLYDPRSPASLVARALPPLARDGILPLNDLAEFLESPSPLVRAAALLSLNVKKSLPTETKALVLARLDDPSAEVRQAALLAAGALQLREAIPRLVEAAGKEDGELRAQTIAALCRMPDPRASAIYRSASRDPDPSLRRAGERALQAIGHPADPGLVRAGDARAKLGAAAELGQYALGHPGDSRKGEELFFGNQSLSCGRCHAASHGTAKEGPDLSGVGLKLDKAGIVRSLLEPAAKLADAHRTVQGPVQALSRLEFTDLVTFLQVLKRASAPANQQVPRERSSQNQEGPVDF